MIKAHSTHVRGAGAYDASSDVEEPRIQVTLATRIPEEQRRRDLLRVGDPAARAGCAECPSCANRRVHAPGLASGRGQAPILPDSQTRPGVNQAASGSAAPQGARSTPIIAPGHQVLADAGT